MEVKIKLSPFIFMFGYVVLLLANHTIFSWYYRSYNPMTWDWEAGAILGYWVVSCTPIMVLTIILFTKESDNE